MDSELDNLYNPSISDLELEQHKGRDTTVVYLASAKQALNSSNRALLERIRSGMPKKKAKDIDDAISQTQGDYISTANKTGYNQALDDVTAVLTALENSL